MNINLFGTDGIRGSVGSSPLNSEELPKLGQSIGAWIEQLYGSSAHVLLAHDTRISCAFVKSALLSGLLLRPLKIYDASILPTPAVCKIMQQNKTFSCGIIISASHNSFQDNGIKIVDANNIKISFNDELIISHYFHTNSFIKQNYNNLGSLHYLPTGGNEYIEKISPYFIKTNFSNIKVVIDCAHGATSYIAPEIFNKLGIKNIVINNRPNGKNINKQCGTLHLQSLQKTVLSHQADIGFAFDGDGDRVIAVNRHGTIKDGDDMLALLLNHKNYMYEKGIVGTIMSNQGLITLLNEKNKKFVRTQVGDKYVKKELESEKMLLGGEQSGHIIMRDYMSTGDGIFTALRILQTIIETQNWDMQTFLHYPQILVNIPVTNKKDLNEPSIAHVIDTYKNKLCHGRLEVRYSGTEKVLRIMIEDSNEQNAKNISQELSYELQKKLCSK